MRRLQSGGDLADPVARLAGSERAGAADSLGERIARHIFHDHVGLLVVDDQVVHRDGIGMVELGGQARLAAHPLTPLAEAGVRVGAQLFDGHRAAEQCVVGEPHLAHRAPAE